MLLSVLPDVTESLLVCRPKQRTVADDTEQLLARMSTRTSREREREIQLELDYNHHHYCY